MLHVANGAITAERLRESGLGGEVFDGDDLIAEGPVPNGLASTADWQARAAWLERHFEIPASDYLAHQARRARVVDDARREDEVVLWFEFDLHCQANLVHLLSVLDTRGTRVSLVCPERVEGMPGFRGLGQLSGAQLSSLFADRVPLAAVTFAAARDVWEAWCDDTPVRLAAVATPEDLPHLRAAVGAHLRRLPWLGDGLSDIERTVLGLVPSAGTGFVDLFAAWNTTAVARPYGFGDHAIARTVRELARGDHPLLALDEPASPRLADARAWHVRRTGEPIARWRRGEGWIGGVRVAADGPRWCWDPGARAPVWTR